jgi:hypothetical protein
VSSSPRPKVLAYYFPDYHRDSRNEQWFGSGWDEWEVVRSGTPRFEGHRQPRVPLGGYADEADPVVFADQIALADQHGVDGFIFDFYWYDDGPYLQRALDEGYLRAHNPGGVEFSLMWANHDLLDIFPRKDLVTPPPPLKSGAIGRDAFERMARHVIDDYFTDPRYSLVDGRPRFSIYEVGAFVRGLGGVQEAADALRWFDAETRKVGLPGVHLDAVVWGFAVLPAEIPLENPASLVAELGFRSASSYVWIHHIDTSLHAFPAGGPWATVEDEVFAQYEAYQDDLGVPFYPNVTVGWDASPRVAADAAFTRTTLPYPPIWDPIPDEFAHALRRARRFCDLAGNRYSEVTLNAWNEWTEGSYLLPDTHNRTAMLERIAEVFGPREPSLSCGATSQEPT